MDRLQQFRDAAARWGGSTTHVDSLIGELVLASCAADQEALLRKLEQHPLGIPAALDCDYVALALQHLAGTAACGDLAKRAIQVALARAICFASGATSGGEGLARSQHVQELEAVYGAA